jgi:hypothetical protein
MCKLIKNEIIKGRMQSYPMIDVLVFFASNTMNTGFEWRKLYRKDIAQIRSAYTKREGGSAIAYYTVSLKEGGILELAYDIAELLWFLPKSVTNEAYQGYTIDRMLALFRRNKNVGSENQRIIPYRFELIKVGTDTTKVSTQRNGKIINTSKKPLYALSERISPYRLLKGPRESHQIIEVVTRHTENLMTTKHLHFVVKTDANWYYHINFEMDLLDWRFIQQVDAEFFFMR